MARRAASDKASLTIYQSVNTAFCVYIHNRRALQDEPADTKKAPRKALFRNQHSDQAFLPPMRPPKRFWKRSIRPPVSITFCLPV